MTVTLSIYEESIINGEFSLSRRSWWKNFVTEARLQFCKTVTHTRFTPKQWQDYRNEILKKQYNAEYGEYELTFANDNDATLFILKWG